MLSHSQPVQTTRYYLTALGGNSCGGHIKKKDRFTYTAGLDFSLLFFFTEVSSPLVTVFCLFNQ